jgi:hypothetical protein
MRKIIVYNIISLDGYHTGSGNDVSVMFPMMGNVFDSSISAGGKTPTTSSSATKFVAQACKGHFLLQDCKAGEVDKCSTDLLYSATILLERPV